MELEKLIYAILIIVVGSLISKIIGISIRKSTNRFNIHGLILDFLEDFVVVVGVMFSIFTALSYLGYQIEGLTISVTAFIGILMGFGLHDMLNNIAAGAWISAVRPFEIGDYVNLKGYKGVVKEINATNIVLIGDDGETVTIPTKLVWNAPIVRFKEKKTKE
ncbi:MscS Mechanosensitive ion channel [Thermococcus onnurineus NA1]|uniref:MscS Mechanosensitive ion channel n=1 Tax=Thermococcus onnurineus (strain NA1) TaxID=523850 RepID=B6YWY7_THEON|nr:mechanosensitive ion channel domain-containing protein [Thermococcus onnurineus]ACJ16600.1 MscS Mechanosensitive ion channel [Thermococcus onnurineus NA1]